MQPIAKLQGGKKAVGILRSLMASASMARWEITYAGIYNADCDVCGKHGQGWFYILNGSHDNGSHCDACHNKPSVTVMNLSTGDEQVFVGMDVAAAVFAAYQQSKGNWETWTYANLYTEQHHLMDHGKRTVAMGDFAAVKNYESARSEA